MAGLLTYALFESLPILPDSPDNYRGRDRNSDYSIFKKLVAITAAGTVAGSHGIPFSD